MSILAKYTSPSNPGSFLGLSGFKKNNKFKDYSLIKNNLAYSLHKQAIRKFPRRQTIANDIDEFWQIDLIDFKKISTSNKNYNFLLCCIDVLSKFAWVKPLKNKSAETCTQAFVEIFKTGRKPKFIYSDWGNEFKGVCKKLFQEEGIIHIDTKSVNKASIVERFNRTLKEKIERFLTFNKNKSYIKALPDLVDSYNNSFHSAINCTPASVTVDNVDSIKKRLYDSSPYLADFAFKIGDYVRIVEDKKLFVKGYKPNWSNEVYIIDMLNPSRPPTYKIKSVKGKEFDWHYYKQELQKVTADEYPFDAYEVIDQVKDKSLVKQLNSEAQKEKWVKRIQPSRKK